MIKNSDEKQDRGTSQWIFRFLLVSTMAAVSFQIFWFSTRCLQDINYDGMAYIGIARHLRNGDVQGSLNAFRSPLISWLIAPGLLLSEDALLMGKLLTIGTCVFSLYLAYIFTRSLWNSPYAAAIAVLWIAFGRGFLALSVQLVTPDFLLTDLVLLYFILLLRCLRTDRTKDWLCLGAVHGLAFLAKGFALPWLTVTTAFGTVLPFQNPRTRPKLRLAFALCIPILVAAAWGTVLKSKYGVFTTGSQFQANFLQWTLREKWSMQGTPNKYSVLRDEFRFYDQYMVDDPLPPGASPWHHPIHLVSAVPAIVTAELRNVPRAMKEILVVVTPGGVLAFFIGLIVLVRRRDLNDIQLRLAIIVLVAASSLVLAYCMLVFDSRYILPIIPLLVAIGVRFIVHEPEQPNDLLLDGRLRISLASLSAAGLLFGLIYWASPMRTLARDHQVACYDAAWKLKLHRGGRLVTIGEGPFPEYGVGWEAGYKAAFFSGQRIIASMEKIPNSAQVESLLNDIIKADPDAVIVWGDVKDSTYQTLNSNLTKRYSDIESIFDSNSVEVGTIHFMDSKAARRTPPTQLSSADS